MLVVKNARLATMASIVPKLTVASKWIFRKVESIILWTNKTLVVNSQVVLVAIRSVLVYVES